jgi:outer membrane protein assembly factor BamA
MLCRSAVLVALLTGGLPVALRAQRDSAAADTAAADSGAVRTRGAGARTLVFPFVFYQPETSIGGGAGLLRSFRAAATARPSVVNLTLVLTAKSQFSISTVGERYSAGDRWRVSWEAFWSRFPDVFYGLGNATRTADEEKFTLENRRAVLDVRRSLAPGLYAGVSAIAHRSALRKLEPGGLLDSGAVTGARGATLGGAGFTVMLDHRDNLFAPFRGPFLTFTARSIARRLGSDLSYTRLELDLRDYRRAAGGTAAAQLLVTAITGDPPFFDLATLGGPMVMRGVFEGRFRDRSRTALQLEYRRHVWRSVGLAAFASAGQVAPRLADQRLADFHAAGGLGVRFLISPTERINGRIDFGFGPGGGGLYFGFGEAF